MSINNNSTLNLEYNKNEFLSRFGNNNPIQINIKNEVSLFKTQFMYFLSERDIVLDQKITYMRFPEVAKHWCFGSAAYRDKSRMEDAYTQNTIGQFFKNLKEPEHWLFFWIEQLFNGGALRFSSIAKPIFLYAEVQREFIEMLEVRSLNINCVFTENGQIGFYPKGDSVLDKVLVEDVMPLTTDNSETLYKKALTSYYEKDFKSAADNLRKCLESWLKNELNITESNLENIAKKELKKVLNTVYGKNLKYHNGFIDHFCQLVSQYYTDIHNKCDIKHPEKDTIPLSEAELEFILYQTGAIIRFLNKVQISEHK